MLMLKIKNFIKNQEGDTNFISIMIILGVVVVLAGLFLTLGKDVVQSATDAVKNFFDGL